ncbi:MAG: hypothetical protein H0W06_13375 [Chloroflexia bacterium]|nr:hypothetical protein [Chloroflexia bacterium]
MERDSSHAHLDATAVVAAAERLRPAHVCTGLLGAMEGSEGRRKKRKRNTTPDAIGLTIKRDLLERAARDDPDPEAFEDWLMEQCLAAGAASGPTRAMALDVLDEWRVAVASGAFRHWLDEGAPSDDRRQE